MKTLAGTVPTVIDIYLDRPAVLGGLETTAAALLADYGASDAAVLRVLFGERSPQGSLPFDLPRSIVGTVNLSFVPGSATAEVRAAWDAGDGDRLAQLLDWGFEGTATFRDLGGMPAISFGAGNDLEKGGVAAGEAAGEAYIRDRYHQPADEFDPNWDYSGMTQEVGVFYDLGRSLADSREWPTW